MKLKNVFAGKVIKMEEVVDPVFSEKMLGDGFATEPVKMQKTEILAPASGVITMAFPTQHAIGITTDDGYEIIVHVGIDTVTLNGEGFNTFVKEGDHVKQGDVLLEVDFAKINGKVPSLVTPVVVTNLNDKKVNILKLGETPALEDVIEIN